MDCIFGLQFFINMLKCKTMVHTLQYSSVWVLEQHSAILHHQREEEMHEM